MLLLAEVHSRLEVRSWWAVYRFCQMYRDTCPRNSSAPTGESLPRKPAELLLSTPGPDPTPVGRPAVSMGLRFQTVP